MRFTPQKKVYEKAISVLIDEAAHSRITQIAKANGIGISELVRQMIDYCVEAGEEGEVPSETGENNGT